jgi:hypothetical protein
MGHYKRHLGVARSDLPCPAVISDELPGGALECPADGRTYTSKADYYRAVKAAGCEILGSKETLPRPKPKKFRLNNDERVSLRKELSEKLQALDSPNRRKRVAVDHFGGSRRFTAP